MTISYGMTLSSEEHPPARLVEMARLAETSGFDFVSVSDHFHPWTRTQGHSPFVWSVLGAISQATDEIDVGVGVTCPTMRIHPAILAQATATVANLLGDRFVWGVGTGEALNEQILGDYWPPADTRLEMLEESIELIRELWRGESVTHRGEHYLVERATIFDPPPSPIPTLVSAFGPQAAHLAAKVGDGLWTSGTDAEIVEMFREAGGSGPVYTQITLCWAESVQEAADTAFKYWPNAALPGQLGQDLRTPQHFEEAVELVTPDLMAEAVACGPDPTPIVDAVQRAVSAGMDHIYFHQIGQDQEGFARWWEKELAEPIRQVAA